VVAGYIDEILTDGPTGDKPLDVLPWVKPFGGRTFDLVIDTQENLRRSLVARRAAEGAFVSAAPRPASPAGRWPWSIGWPAAGPGHRRAGAPRPWP
jgi:ADP-heptose:LPS heptosyltransferase